MHPGASPRSTRLLTLAESAASPINEASEMTAGASPRFKTTLEERDTGSTAATDILVTQFCPLGRGPGGGGGAPKP